MKQEDKELLIKDLCARLPYGVYVNMLSFSKKIQIKVESISLSDDTYLIINDTWYLKDEYPKPYLRPMSSMTEEEKKELNDITVINCNEFEGCSTLFDEEGFDWLNKRMFDYRGLIEKGLALEAPKDMYKTKEK